MTASNIIPFRPRSPVAPTRNRPDWLALAIVGWCFTVWALVIFVGCAVLWGAGR